MVRHFLDIHRLEAGELRAILEHHSRIAGQKTHELLAVRRQHRGADW